MGNRRESALSKTQIQYDVPKWAKWRKTVTHDSNLARHKSLYARSNGLLPPTTVCSATFLQKMSAKVYVGYVTPLRTP